MTVLLYLQGFTAGYTNEKITQTQSMFLSFIKEKIFSFPVIKRTNEQSRLIRILAIPCILALNM